MKVEALEGYIKIFLNVHRLKEESNDIKYLINWIWAIRELIWKQEIIK